MSQNDERERLTLEHALELADTAKSLEGTTCDSNRAQALILLAAHVKADATEIAELRKNAFGWRFDLFDEAWHEAYKRYPGAEGALVFLRTAIGPTQTPNEADLKWAETALAAHTEGMKGKENV